MILPIGAAGSNFDPEYQRIVRELQLLGISPSGNKTVDKSKLELAKIELAEKINARNTAKFEQEIQVRPIEDVNDTEGTKRAELEVSRVGAMSVAELNKIYFGL